MMKLKSFGRAILKEIVDSKNNYLEEGILYDIVFINKAQSFFVKQ